MGLNCSCPSENLTPIIVDDCEIHIGQIQKLLFQKSANSFNMATADAKLLASWTPLLIADDATTVVVTPLLKADPQIEDGGIVTKGGGDNTTLNGVELVVGHNPGKFSAKFHGLDGAAIAAMRTMECQFALGVFLVNEYGNIYGHTISGIAIDFRPIPITGFHLGAKVNQGFGEIDYNEVFFSVDNNYDERLISITPTDFDALTALDKTA